MTQTEIEIQKDKIDAFLITTDITLLAAFLLILAVDNKSSSVNILTVISIITSVIAFSLSLIFSLWHKYRNALRKNIFERLKEKAIDDFAKQLESIKIVAKNQVSASVAKFFLTNKSKKISNQEMQNELIKMVENSYETDKLELEPIIKAMSENTANNFSKIFLKAYKKPLAEKFSKTKFCIDYLSQKLRYILFVIGLGTFSITIISKITE